MTPHNGAQMGDFAKTVLMPGDPLRSKFIAEEFLDTPRLVNEVRSILGYTGTYKGVPVSVMASGMGMPSIGIYSYELYQYYGVENIVRIGSAGSYVERLNVRDVVLAERAFSDSTFALKTSGVEDKIMYPSEELNAIIMKKAEELGIDCKEAVVHSSDAFYTAPNVGGWQDIREKTGTECVEMESFALFHNARMLNKRAACILTISDSFCTNEVLSAEDRQNSFREMMKLALESAIAF
ncbi:MAG: purine-nucleoside phosphorylase [Bacteroidales bacterium]|nr:purine-nucleoside phosphorylase [Bacteroidales bacterium]MCM1147632.1 purine-nucleoside phosphorylase [Bacteroidales bacterium]